MDGHAGGGGGAGLPSGKKSGWLRLLLSEISEPAFTCDKDAILRYMNEPFRRLLGNHRHAGLGRPFAAIFPAGSRKPAELASKRALSGAEAECELPSGPAPMMFRIKPIVDSGRVHGFLGIGRLLSNCSLAGGRGECAFGLEQLLQKRTAELISTNELLLNEIIERKQAEKALRESEMRYRSMIEAAHDAIFAADARTGVIINANSRAAELMDMPMEGLIGLHQSSLHPEEHAEQYKAMFRERVRLGVPFSGGVQYVLRSGGRGVPVRIGTSLARSGETLIIHGIFRELSKKGR